MPTAMPTTREEPPKTIEEPKKPKVKLPKPQPTFAVVKGPVIVSFQ
jgi:hypothetical protein